MRGVPYGKLPLEFRRAVKEFYTGYETDVPEMTRWKWTRIPLGELTEEVWSDPELKEGHRSFEAYHRWFIRSGGWPPKWTRRDPDSVYPVILTGPPGGPYDPEKGVIEDGWNRFHWYVDHWDPRKLIPVVWPV